jgi:hypothetical protein
MVRDDMSVAGARVIQRRKGSESAEATIGRKWCASKMGRQWREETRVCVGMMSTRSVVHSLDTLRLGRTNTDVTLLCPASRAMSSNDPAGLTIKSRENCSARWIPEVMP